MITARVKTSNIEKALKEIPLKVRKSVMTGMTRAAAKEIFDEARRLAPHNELKTAMVLKKRRMRDIDKVHFAVSNLHWHAVFTEYGTLGNRTAPLVAKGKRRMKWSAKSKKGTHMKKRNAVSLTPSHGIPEQPFMRPALDAKWEESYGAAKKYFWKRFQKILAAEQNDAKAALLRAKYL